MNKKKLIFIIRKLHYLLISFVLMLMALSIYVVFHKALLPFIAINSFAHLSFLIFMKFVYEIKSMGALINEK